MTDDRPAANRTLSVPARFAGPPGTGNGGVVAGSLAGALNAGDQPIQVTLRQPPPLDTPMDVVLADDGSRLSLTFGGAILAEAGPGSLTHRPIDPVSFETATERMAHYAGLTGHPFPGCFVCGPDRAVPDGLGLRPGRLDDRPDTVATAWVPDATVAAADGSVPLAMVWAALDCPGGWSADLIGRPMVLGRVTAEVGACPEVGDRCVVLGRLLGSEGRKTFTASTAYDGDGRVLGRAEATWIEVRQADPA